MRTLTTLLALVATPIVAQDVPCATRDAAVEYLETEHGERQQAIMLDSTGLMVEIYASEGGSWSMLVTGPGGPTCMISHGQAFNLVAEPFGEDM